MKSNNIKVVARFRPLIDIELELSESQAASISFVNDSTVMLNEGGSTKPFTFDKVFSPSTSQAEIFDYVGKPKIEDVMNGYNGTIFAYGQTGSGKTHTMMGSDIYEEHLRGIIPRAASLVFEIIHRQTAGTEFTLKCSMLEIYKEELQDLLTEKKSKLKIKQDKRKGIYVEGLSFSYVSSVEEILNLISAGTSNRTVAVTKMNSQSSRSHTLFMLEVNQKLANDSEKRGTLNLVDLAGSEKVNKAGVTGEGLEEAKKINSSLSELGNVIHSLIKKHEHIPYRNSKLTRLLQESLGGNFKTTLVVNCSPHMRNAEETRSTLKFASRAKNIKNKVTANVRKSHEELMKTIEELKAQLAAALKEIERLKKRGRILHQQSLPIFSEDDGEADDFDTGMLEKAISLEQEKEDLLEKVNKLQKSLDKEKKKRLEAEEKALDFYDKYNKLKLAQEKEGRRNDRDDEEKSSLKEQIQLLEGYLVSLKSKYEKSLWNIRTSFESDQWNFQTFDDIELRLDIPIYTEENSIQVDAVPEDKNVNIYSSTKEIETDDKYVKGVVQSLEDFSSLSPELQLFQLKKQVIMAGIVNAGISKEYFHIFWKFNLLKEKFKLKHKAEKSLKENIRVLEKIIQEMQNSHKDILSLACSLNEDTGKSKIVKPVVAEKRRVFKRGITSVNNNTRLDFKTNDESHFNAKKLELSLHLQTLHNQDLRNGYSILKEERDSLKELLNSFEKNVIESYGSEKTRWKQYMDDFNAVTQEELMRRQAEVRKLNELLGHWIHLYMELCETKAGASARDNYEALLKLSTETEKSLKKIHTHGLTNPIAESFNKPAFASIGKSTGDTIPFNEF